MEQPDRGKDLSPQPYEDPEEGAEYGGKIMEGRDDVAVRPLSAQGKLEAFGVIKAHGTLTGPSSLAILWFGTADALVGGVLWLLGGPALGIAVMVVGLLTILTYTLVNPSSR